MIYPKPYSIYLMGTLVLEAYRSPFLIPKSKGQLCWETYTGASTMLRSMFRAPCFSKKMKVSPIAADKGSCRFEGSPLCEGLLQLSYSFKGVIQGTK